MLGDISYFSSMAYATVSPLAPGLIEGDWNKAGRIWMLHFEAYAVSGSLFFGTQHVVRRARPRAIECSDGDDSTACTGNSTRSFPGGHLAIVTTNAALACFHDPRMDIYNNDIVEYSACGLWSVATFLAFAGRVTTGNHHLTDQITGLSLGLFAGGLVPWLLHPEIGRHSADESTSLSVTVVPSLSNTGVGLQAAGSW